MENPASAARGASIYEVVSGEIDLRTPKGVEVRTRGTKTRIPAAGTAAIRMDNSGGAEIRVYSGEGEVVTKTGDTVVLGQQEAVRVDVAGVPGPKLVLPASPRNLTPPHQSNLAYADPARATTTLTWDAVPTASSYHLMLDYSPLFTKPLVDRTGIKGTSIQLRGLSAGKYYWRVAAVARSGIEGSFGDFARFVVL